MMCSQSLAGATGERGWGGCVMPITNVRMSVVNMMLSPFFKSAAIVGLTSATFAELSSSVTNEPVMVGR